MKKYFCDICKNEVKPDDPTILGRISVAGTVFPPESIQDICQVCTTNILNLLLNIPWQLKNDNP